MCDVHKHLQAFVSFIYSVIQSIMLRMRDLLYFTFSSTILLLINCYPDKLSCSRSLTVGSVIMGGPAYSDVVNQVSVQRKGAAINSGSVYAPGETLTVSLSNAATSNYIFQVSNAKFTGGTCSNTRVYAGPSSVGVVNNVATLTMPASGSGNVQVWAGWASGFNTIGITLSFTLIDPALKTSVNPSTFPITNSPSISRSISPSSKSTFAPSNPTFISTIIPSVAPSSLPTVAAFNFAEYYLILILNGLATPTLDTQSQLSLIQAVATVGKISPNYISYYQSNIVIHCIISFTLRISGHGRMLRESRSLLAPISGTYSLNATLLIRRPYSKGVASSVMQTDHDNLLLLLTTSAVLSELTSAATSNNAIAITQDVAISSIGSSAVTFSTPSDSPVASPPTGDNTIQPTNFRVVIGAAVGGTLGFLMLAGIIYGCFCRKKIENNMDNQFKASSPNEVLDDTQVIIESK